MPRLATLLLSALLMPSLAAQGDPRPPRPDRPPRPERPDRPERPSRDSRPKDPYKDPEPLKPPADYPTSGDRDAKPERRGSEGWTPYPQAPQGAARRSPRPGWSPGRGSETSTTLHPGAGSLYPSEARSREQARAWERGRSWHAGGAWGQHPSWHEHRARHWETEHRSWRDRGGYGGYLIPGRDFQARFGPERGFRLRTRPAIRNGYPWFSWGGYAFQILDPWPEFWAETWYADDELWIGWDDGYYLYSRRHPGFGLALTLTF